MPRVKCFVIQILLIDVKQEDYVKQQERLVKFVINNNTS